MRRSTGAAAALGACLALAGTAAAAPKPAGPTGPAPFIGHAAVAHPITGMPLVPQNPNLAPNARSTTHNDTWQSDTYTGRGPLGRHPVRRSNNFTGDCISTSFDHKGRMVAICIDPSVGPTLYMFDPRTLAIIAKHALPPRQPPPPGISPLKDTGGGAYFYLDNKDRIWNGTTTRHIQVIREQGRGFALDRDYDLSHILRDDERINSVLPDWSGKIWFVARRDGVIGLLDPTTGKVNLIRVGNGLEGEIENSFAVGRDGAYIATNREMLRVRVGAGMKPQIVWRAAYKTIKGLTKPGQFDDGTGTTPTIMPGGYVAITDNADPMNVVVYRTAARLKPGQQRKVCETPVFTKGASDTENSLVSAGRSLIVENNYGYDVLQFAANPSLTSAPGIARVDLNKAGTGCHVVWTNRTVRVPSVISKLSLGTGLLYTFTNPPSSGGNDPWYWTALDFRTGRTVWNILAGNGSAWNNHYAGINLGPDGTAYLSGFPGGWWSLSDGR